MFRFRTLDISTIEIHQLPAWMPAHNTAHNQCVCAMAEHDVARPRRHQRPVSVVKVNATNVYAQKCISRITVYYILIVYSVLTPHRKHTQREWEMECNGLALVRPHHFADDVRDDHTHTHTTYTRDKHVLIGCRLSNDGPAPGVACRITPS